MAFLHTLELIARIKSFNAMLSILSLTRSHSFSSLLRERPRSFLLIRGGVVSLGGGWFPWMGGWSTLAGGDGQLTDVGFHHAVVNTPGFSQIHTAVQKYRACYWFKDVTKNFRRLDSFFFLFRHDNKWVSGDLPNKCYQRNTPYKSTGEDIHKPFGPWEWLAPNFSFQCRPWITC